MICASAADPPVSGALRFTVRLAAVSTRILHAVGIYVKNECWIAPRRIRGESGTGNRRAQHITCMGPPLSRGTPGNMNGRILSSLLGKQLLLSSAAPFSTGRSEVRAHTQKSFQTKAKKVKRRFDIVSGMCTCFFGLDGKGATRIFRARVF